MPSAVHLPLRILQRVVESIPTGVRQSIARDLTTPHDNSSAAQSSWQRSLNESLQQYGKVLSHLSNQVRSELVTRYAGSATAHRAASAESSGAAQVQVVGSSSLPVVTTARWMASRQITAPVSVIRQGLPIFGRDRELPFAKTSGRGFLPIDVDEPEALELSAVDAGLESRLSPWLPQTIERVAVMDFRRGYHWIWRLTDQTRHIRRPYLMRLDLARIQPDSIPDPNQKLRGMHKCDKASDAFESTPDGGSDAQV